MKKSIVLIGFILINILIFGETATGEAKNTETAALLKGCKNTIMEMEYSPDGKYLACSSDYEMLIWNVISGELILKINTDEYPYLLKFSPDNKYIAYNKKIYRIEDGKCIRYFVKEYNRDEKISYSADGKKVYFYNRKNISQWNIESGECIKNIDLTSEKLYEIALSSDNNYLAKIDSNGIIRIVELESNKCIQQINVGDLLKGSIYFRANNRYLVGNMRNESSFWVWDWIENKIIKYPIKNNEDLENINLTEDLKYIVISDRWYSQKIEILEAATGRAVNTCLTDWEKKNNFVKCSPDGRFIAAAQSDDNIRIWSYLFEYKRCVAVKDIKIGEKLIEKNSICVASEKEKKILEPVKGELSEGDVKELEKIKIYCSKAGEIYKDVETKEVKGKINAGKIPESAYYYEAYDKYYIEDSEYSGWIKAENVKKLYSCNIRARIKTDNVNSFENIDGKIKHKYMSGDIIKVDFKSLDGYFYSENSGWILCDNVEIIYDLIGKDEIGYPKEKLRILDNQICILDNFKAHKTKIAAIAYSPNGKYIASTGDDNVIKILDIANKNCLMTLKGHGDLITMILYSPDGKYLVTSSQDITIKIWDIELKRCVKTLTDHKRWVKTLAYSADGKYLASGGNDNLIKIWDTNSWECIKTIDDCKDWIKSVAFSPNGEFLAASSDNGEEMEWEIDNKLVKRKSRIRKERCKTLFYFENGKNVIKLLDNREVVMSYRDELNTGRIYIELSEDEIIYNITQNYLVSRDGSRISITDIESEKKVHLVTKNNNYNDILANSPDGKYLASGNEKGIIKVWQVSTEYDRAVALKCIDIQTKLEAKYMTAGKISKGTVCLIEKESANKVRVINSGKGSADLDNFEILDKVDICVKENSVVYKDNDLVEPIYKFNNKSNIGKGYYSKTKNLYYIENSYFKGWVKSENIIVVKQELLQEEI